MGAAPRKFWTGLYETGLDHRLGAGVEYVQQGTYLLLAVQIIEGAGTRGLWSLIGTIGAEREMPTRWVECTVICTLYMEQRRDRHSTGRGNSWRQP